MRYKKDLQNYVFFFGGGGGIPCRTKGVIIVDVACEQAPSEGGKKHSAIESVIPWAKLVPLTLDYTRLARSKTNREPVRRLLWTKITWLKRNKRLYRKMNEVDI